MPKKTITTPVTETPRPFIPIHELHRWFVRPRSYHRYQVESCVFIRSSHYNRHTAIVRLKNGCWSCTDDRLGRWGAFNIHLRPCEKEVLKALAALRIIDPKEVTSHVVMVEGIEQERDAKDDRRELLKLAGKLGVKLPKSFTKKYGNLVST